MNFADLTHDELDDCAAWQLALRNHPHCALLVGWSMCRAGAFVFPDVCPYCTEPIPGDEPN